MTSILGQREWKEAKRSSEEQAAVKDAANKSSVSKPGNSSYISAVQQQLSVVSMCTLMVLGLYSYTI